MVVGQIELASLCLEFSWCSMIPMDELIYAYTSFLPLGLYNARAARAEVVALVSKFQPYRLYPSAANVRW